MLVPLDNWPGRGGRGGARIEPVEPVEPVAWPPLCASPTVCVRNGRLGLNSPVSCGVILPFADPLLISCLVRMLAMEWWTGGGSKVVPLTDMDLLIWSRPGRGRVGRLGGGESSSGLALRLLSLFGGLLKGELSGATRGCAGASCAFSVRKAGFVPIRGAGISGFSARLTGGGGGLAGGVDWSRSRRSSAERRGGGGDGGCDGVRRGERRDSRLGVCGRLGILKGRGEDAEEEAVGVVGTAATESALRKTGWSESATFVSRPLGGDCGGCTIRVGGLMGFGLSGGPGPSCVGDRSPSPARMPDRFRCSGGRDLSETLVCGTSGFGMGGSRDLNGFGTVGGGRGACPPELPRSCAWLIFSNWLRREDTGFYVGVSTPGLRGEVGDRYISYNGRVIRPFTVLRGHGYGRTKSRGSESLITWSSGATLLSCAPTAEVGLFWSFVLAGAVDVGSDLALLASPASHKPRRSRLGAFQGPRPSGQCRGNDGYTRLLVFWQPCSSLRLTRTLFCFAGLLRLTLSSLGRSISFLVGEQPIEGVRTGAPVFSVTGCH